MARQSFSVTGTNNPNKQASVDWANGLAAITARGLPTTPQDFGAVGDGVTDDGAAFTAAIAYLATHQTTGYGYTNGAPPLYIPRGIYNLGTTTLDIFRTMRIVGEGCGMQGGSASVLKWSDGVTGIRVQRVNTSGEASTGSNASGGDQSIIDGLLLIGAYSGTESESHGINMRAAARISNCAIWNFSGDGIYSKTVAGGTPEGNASLFSIERVWVENCRNGMFFDGADTSAGIISNCSVVGNRRWGIWDSSFLGNTHISPHASSNGYGHSITPTSVAYNGHRYSVIPGQETGAATNAPTGAATSNTWWRYMYDGAADLNNSIPDWTNGITVRSGGAYYTDSASASNLFLNPYVETGQGGAHYTNPTMVLNGAASGGQAGFGGRMSSSGNGIQFDGDVDAAGVIKIGGVQILTGRATAIADPSGGSTVDAEARTAIITLMNRLRFQGLLAVA